MRHPKISTGALMGLLLIIPLIAILYAANQIGGLPFVPFDLLDWVTRTLPGDLITAGIDGLVVVLSGLGLGLAATAKTVEQIMAVLAVTVVGPIAGAVAFAIFHRRKPVNDAAGLILGAVVGLPFALISFLMNQAVFGLLWIMAGFMIWGLVLGRVYLGLVPSGNAPALERVSRREFLIRLGGASAAITLVGAGLGSVIATAKDRRGEAVSAPASYSPPPDLPNADDPLVPASGTRLEYPPVDDHYRIDINVVPSFIDGDWNLPIAGEVENPVTLTLDDIQNNYESMDQYITLSCISNPVGGDLIGTTRWTGVSLQRILETVKPTGNYLRVYSQDGFHETVAIDLIESDERIMLAYLWDGKPLELKHGYPLRIYIPDRYGMKQPKWIVGIDVIADWEPGYWVKRGWDREAIVRSTSVIDTVAVDDVFEENGQQFIPVGGIAYAGARGISKVEVRIDGGDWQEAQLRTPLSELTWVIWRYDWPFAEGAHLFEVRCTDGDGASQIVEVDDSHPSGATGIHSFRERV